MIEKELFEFITAHPGRSGLECRTVIKRRPKTILSAIKRLETNGSISNVGSRNKPKWEAIEFNPTFEENEVIDSTTPFDRRIDTWPAHGAPVGMKDALVEVIDTLEIIKLGLESMGLTPAAYDLLETYDRVEAKRKELSK